MTAPLWIEALGAIAGFSTTFAFVPQIVQIYRQGGRPFLRDAFLLSFWRSPLAGLRHHPARKSRRAHESGHRYSDRFRHRP
jgi:hypothetical protein